MLTAWRQSSHLVQERQDLDDVQLDVLQVQEVLVVLLLRERPLLLVPARNVSFSSHLFQQVINLEVHLQDRLIATIVVERDD